MATDDFFRALLEQMIDVRHALAVLATRMRWAQIEASLAPLFAHKDRTGRVIEDAERSARRWRTLAHPVSASHRATSTSEPNLQVVP